MTQMTSSGHRGLVMHEPLLFEQDADGRTGVDLPEPEGLALKLGGLERAGRIGLPGVSEPQVVRHFTRLSQKNYAIDAGLYPLGSCTMKHNPRLNEKVARLPGFAMAHPLQPQQTVTGCLELIGTLAHWLCTLTGMPGVAMSPAAGAHGELAGLMTIRAALTDRGDARKRVLAPESAHGTNPATAALCGYKVESIPANARGRIDVEVLREALDEDVAALMLTNPNTCGLFEDEVVQVAELIHDAGAFFYADGANFNAIVGRVRPGDLGVDAMHINLHKTFSTPHGGGGPGSGPVVLSEPLVPYAPLPCVVADGESWSLVEQDATGKSFGRLRGFHGQMGMFVRALAYMMSHGSDGLRQVAEDSVLNANYVMARLKGAYNLPFPGPCMHECLFDDHTLRDTDVSTLDLAKAMIDEGFHPMTMYFPLVVHGAMLIEPTETESRQSLDLFCDTMLHLMERAQSGDAAWFHDAPHLAPWSRLDETAAARHPVLTWRPQPETNRAA
ncbi:MAG: aminomethyl-transferring glycine dehydrogenase subunit GcvPB [Rhodospirillales bacterium]|nr:aminomethyl-transferring glycine dehydrogenase subunit GcvPB [Rhodospirillales bacterium]